MIKLEQLINQLCPDGVIRRKLSEVGQVVSGLKGKSKDDFMNGNAPYVSYIDISYNAGLSQNITSMVQVKDNEKQNEIQLGDVLVTGSSETKNEVGLTSVVTFKPKQKTYLNSFCFIWRPNGDLELNPHFTKHYFRSQEFRDKVIASANGVTRQNLSKPKFLDIEFPIPHIEVQNEIVSILDKFTELEARKKQYEFYYTTLFDLKKVNISTKKFKVSEICDISRGIVISKEYLRDNSGEFPVYSSQTLNNGIFGFINTYKYDFESLTWTTDGANAGSIFYHNNEKFTITNVCGLIKVKDKELVSTRFLYYLLKSVAPTYVNPSMGNPKLMSNIMSSIEVQIPHISKQLEIVSILDEFEELITSLNSGLPAEIEARRKQYEYYRNKLLTFKELKSA